MDGTVRIMPKTPTFRRCAPGIATAQLLSAKEAEAIRQTLAQQSTWRTATVGVDGRKAVRKEFRLSRVIREKRRPFLFAAFRSRIEKALAQARWFPGWGLPVGPLQAVHYHAGGFYRPHLDNYPGSRRFVSVVCYLNDEFDGGGTYFPHLKFRVNPRAGKVVIFDATLLHGAEPVKGGEKSILIGWVLDKPRPIETTHVKAIPRLTKRLNEYSSRLSKTERALMKELLLRAAAPLWEGPRAGVRRSHG